MRGKKFFTQPTNFQKMLSFGRFEGSSVVSENYSGFGDSTGGSSAEGRGFNGKLENKCFRVFWGTGALGGSDGMSGSFCLKNTKINYAKTLAQSFLKMLMLTALQQWKETHANVTAKSATTTKKTINLFILKCT